ncbi:hypothetical protein AX15_001532 [Amanita polypyramis BW_CC]|nr:hypothetical protein AX15_001532 [Amanita polypyramis BW_CC]
MGWGPSRVRDEFLFYHQKESDTAEELVNPVTPWAQMMRRREQPSHSSNSTNQHQPVEPERLIKQTYSVLVYLPVDRPRGIVRKWHLTAYFSQQKLANLETIDSIHMVGNTVVPDGWFRSARTAPKMRRESRNYGTTSQLAERNLYPSTTSNLGEIPSLTSDFPHSREVLQLLHHSPSSSPRRSPSSSPNVQAAPLAQRISNSQQLVPLEYLQSVSAPQRDPMDEQLLRRFSGS